MPTGTAFTPRAGPKHIAVVRHPRLPKREISDSFLAVFIRADPLARSHLFEIQFQQLAVSAAGSALLLDAEINGTILSAVGESLRNEAANEANDFLDEIGGVRKFMRAHAIEHVEIFEKRFLVLSSVVLEVASRFPDCRNDLIFHVGDIHNVANFEAAEFQITPNQIRTDEGAEVANVREIMDGGTAAVHTGCAGRGGTKLLQRSRQGVEKLYRHFSRAEGRGKATKHKAANMTVQLLS